MRLDGERESQNIEDRRGDGGGSGPFGGGGGGFGGGGGGLPIPINLAGGGIGVIVLIVLALLFGVNPAALLTGGDPPPSSSRYDAPGRPPPQARTQESRATRPAPGDDAARFVSQVLASTEDVWTAVLRENGRTYQQPQLVLFTGATRSGCGAAQAAMGPFYCPNDQKVYLDIAFFRDMERQLGAPGDFARAYVIAHEVGHHVQNQLGIINRVDRLRRNMDERESNALQVRVELQADCFAGVWANRAQQMRNILEQGDVEEGLNAASSVGDDRLQRRSQGYVVPDSFTHGSSAQRASWFRRGLQGGDIRQCDTFNARM